MINKSKLKRIISVVLSLLIITLTPLTTSYVYGDDLVRGIFPKDQSLINYGVELMDMEDSKAFEIYMALMSVNTETIDIKVDFETPVILDAKTQEEILTIDADKIQAVTNAAQLAIDAFRADYPEIFWYDIEESSCKAVWAKQSHPDGSQSYIIEGISIKFSVYPDYSEDLNTTYDNVVNELKSVISQTEGMNRYNKLMYFHDYLCDKIEYGMDNSDAFDIYGALITGQATCEGYSEAFKAICDLAGIPCVTVRGKSKENADDEGVNHMWNYCLMEDDKWYAVDVTWDDPGFQSYDFFLVGSQTVVMTGDRTFADTHLANGDFSLSNIHEFTYPELSETAYESQEFKYGDVNGDTIINGEDALAVLKISARLINANETERISGDVDGNEIINSQDALYVLQYAARLIDKFPIE